MFFEPNSDAASDDHHHAPKSNDASLDSHEIEANTKLAKAKEESKNL